MPRPAVVAKLLEQYDLAPVKIAPRQTGYRNHSYHATLTDGREVNLIVYKRDPDILARIRRANALSDYAADRGLPARRTLEPGIVRLRTPGAIAYAALYNYLPGATIPWEAYTRRHLKLLGATMSDLHATLNQFPRPHLIQNHTASGEYRAILDRMERYFADPGVTNALREHLGLRLSPHRLRRFETALAICTRLPHQQPLHLDFVRGNVLFETRAGEPTVSGILDFEKVAWGHPLIDVARTLAFLLVDCRYKTATEIRRYFLQSGYARRGHQPLRNLIVNADNHRLDLLEELVSLFLLHDFYKFLRHNPYESLPANEHFVRTHDLLLQRRLITAVPIALIPAKPVS